MNLYVQSYVKVLKRNFMLAIIAFVLLAVTFFVWAGVPFFIVGSLVADLTSNFAIIYLCISLSGGFLFSFYFLPINLKVAKNVAGIKQRSKGRSFVYLQTIWMLVCSSLFAIVMYMIIPF